MSSAGQAVPVLTQTGAEERSLGRHTQPGVKKGEGSLGGGVAQGHASSVSSSNSFVVDIKVPKEKRTPIQPLSPLSPLSPSTPLSPTASNTPNSKFCFPWAVMGECKSNPLYMQTYCSIECAYVAKQQVNVAVHLTGGEGVGSGKQARL